MGTYCTPFLKLLLILKLYTPSLHTFYKIVYTPLETIYTLFILHSVYIHQLHTPMGVVLDRHVVHLWVCAVHPIFNSVHSQ